MDTALQPAPILRSMLVDPPWALPRGAALPGTAPAGADDWLRADDAFAGQMALRDRLIAERAGDVHALDARAVPAAREILEMALAVLAARPGYLVTPGRVARPDGVEVPLDRDAPLLTLGRLVQEDICLLQETGAGHVLTGAILCFPASWVLAEKMHRPLVGIHAPVSVYDDDVARRVQRLFDAIRPGRPLVRANCLMYDDASLFQPRSEGARRDRPDATAGFVRSERQCLLRLPDTGAVAFTIHTTVVRRAALSPGDRAALSDHVARGDGAPSGRTAPASRSGEEPGQPGP